MGEGIRINKLMTSLQCFTISYLENWRECMISSQSIKKTATLYSLNHICTHSHIYSIILSFNKCRLMKTTTKADGCLSQLKVLTWINSWFSWQFHHCEAQKWWKTLSLNDILPKRKSACWSGGGGNFVNKGRRGIPGFT